MSRNEGCDVDLHLNHIQIVINIFKENAKISNFAIKSYVIIAKTK
jgi:hypothetical protein